MNSKKLLLIFSVLGYLKLILFIILILFGYLDLIILKNALYLIKNNEDELGKKYLKELIEKESKLKIIAQEIIKD